MKPPKKGSKLHKALKQVMAMAQNDFDYGGRTRKRGDGEALYTVTEWLNGKERKK